MDETNKIVTNTLVKQISDLMIYLELVENDDSLEKDLDNNEPFKKDVKEFVGLITPYIPCVGLVCGLAHNSDCSRRPSKRIGG